MKSNPPDSTSPIEPWTCPTCNTALATSFCPNCGESPLRPRDLTLSGLFDQFLEAVTSIDGRLLRSFRYLISRPGFMTVAYLDGRRKSYIGPIQLFFFSNVLFFATESMTGGRIFTTPLNAHLHNQPWNTLAESLVSARLAATQRTIQLYAPVFDKAMAVHARSLIIFMALSFAPALWVVFHRNGRPLVTHAAFTLHLYSFMLLTLSVATIVPLIDGWLGGGGFASEPLDHALAVALLAACAVYLYVGTGIVYNARGAARVFKVAGLTVGVAGIVLGYRFVLFLITLYNT